jgi:hypothetical protein
MASLLSHLGESNQPPSPLKTFVPIQKKQQPSVSASRVTMAALGGGRRKWEEIFGADSKTDTRFNAPFCSFQLIRAAFFSVLTLRGH